MSQIITIIAEVDHLDIRGAILPRASPCFACRYDNILDVLVSKKSFFGLGRHGTTPSLCLSSSVIAVSVNNVDSFELSLCSIKGTAKILYSTDSRLFAFGTKKWSLPLQSTIAANAHFGVFSIILSGSLMMISMGASSHCTLLGFT